MEDGLIRKVRQYQFRKSDLLGKGATGEVYLGQDTNNGMKVACKVINMSKIDNEVTAYLLNNEKTALQTLRHPNIIHTLDIIQEPDYCYIFTEFCNQGTLSDTIANEGKLNEDQALSIFRYIVEGYKVILQNGIIHRDIKPANILMHDGNPLISDFGYCQIIGAVKPKVFYNVGSPSYMAPQAFVVNLYSQKSDVWSLGVVLYEMLVGSTFDGGGDIMECITNVGKHGVPYPSPVSPYCKHIINNCLHLDPSKRIGLSELFNILLNRQQITQQLSKLNGQQGEVPAARVPQARGQVPNYNVQVVHNGMPNGTHNMQNGGHHMVQNGVVIQQQLRPPTHVLNQQYHQILASQRNRPILQQYPNQNNVMPLTGSTKILKHHHQQVPNSVRPTTHHTVVDSSHSPNRMELEHNLSYQQLYQWSIQSQKGMQQTLSPPRQMSSHPKLQNNRVMYSHSQPDEVLGRGPMQHMRKMPSVGHGVFRSKHQPVALTQSMHNPNGRMHQIFIPTYNRGMPQQPYRQMHDAFNRPITTLVSPQPRSVTSVPLQNEVKLVRSVITDRGFDNPQFTQKPFQKAPQSMLIKPQSNYIQAQLPFNQRSPDNLKHRIVQSPVSPIYPVLNQVPIPQNDLRGPPTIQQASFKKPQATKHIEQLHPQARLNKQIHLNGNQHHPAMQQQQIVAPHSGMGKVDPRIGAQNINKGQSHIRNGVPTQRVVGSNLPVNGAVEQVGIFRSVK